MTHADFSRPFILEIDASHSSLGAVLSQYGDSGVRPVAYASRGLRPTERNILYIRKYGTESKPVVAAATPHCVQAVAEAEKVYKPRPDLTDVALEGGEVLFVDGSAKIDEKGKNRVGYALTTDSKIVKAGPLPGHLSAQAAELIELTEACKMYKGKEVTIYTDSQYAFGTVHQYRQQWKK